MWQVSRPKGPYWRILTLGKLEKNGNSRLKEIRKKRERVYKKVNTDAACLVSSLTRLY